MNKIFSILTFLLFISCGNTGSNTGSPTPVDCDSCVIVEEEVFDVDSCVSFDEYVDEEEEESDIVKVFYVDAEVYKVNPITYRMKHSSSERLRVTLYSNNTAFAEGKQGVQMQVHINPDKNINYYFVCSVYGSKYIYFFDSDEIE